MRAGDGFEECGVSLVVFRRRAQLCHPRNACGAVQCLESRGGSN